MAEQWQCVKQENLKLDSERREQKYLGDMSGADQVNVADAAFGGGLARQDSHVSWEFRRERGRTAIGFRRSGGSGGVGFGRLVDSNDALREALHLQIRDVDEVLGRGCRRGGFRRLRVHSRAERGCVRRRAVAEVLVENWGGRGFGNKKLLLWLRRDAWGDERTAWLGRVESEIKSE